MKYEHSKIEKKWQDIWEEKGVFHAEDENSVKEKFFALIEFPYPSGQGLHVGHPRPYTALDTVARKRRLQTACCSGAVSSPPVDSTSGMRTKPDTAFAIPTTVLFCLPGFTARKKTVRTM